MFSVNAVMCFFLFLAEFISFNEWNWGRAMIASYQHPVSGGVEYLLSSHTAPFWNWKKKL